MMSLLPGTKVIILTAIKQVAVTSSAHFKNLTRYLNDERALMRDSQNLIDSDRWAEEMQNTRAAYGHDRPSRAGATNTVMYHQIIAFNPDECSVNGGVMTPEKCMTFAKQWVETRYANHETVWVLHKERCAADKTERYAVHIGINRTDLETGRRLNEGRSKNAKIERANAMRDLDRKWGLWQMEAGKRNSMVHAIQSTRAEKTMAQRGIRTDKEYLREAIKVSITEAQKSPQKNKAQVFKNSLDSKGVSVTNNKAGNDFTFLRRTTGRKVNGVKLGRGFSRRGLVHALGKEATYGLEYLIEQSMDDT